jgi:plastocyanin
MRTTPWFFALVGAVAWSVIAGGPASAGSIKGLVQLAGSPGEPRRLAVTIDQFVCGKDKDAEDLVLSPQKGIRNVVVWLESPPPGARAPSPAPPAQIDQKQCVFTPRIVMVPAGGTVEFLNSDRLLHNIHSVSKDNPPVNRTQPKGRTIPVVFTKPEIIRIKCDLHSWMNAWVIVADHPFYAVTDGQGEFVLDNLPSGRYTLRIWHESLGTLRKDVTVSDGVTAVTMEMDRK